MKRSPEPLRVGLKYCGGCKPDYDRVALVEKIRTRLGDKVQLVRPDTQGTILVLAVHGCPTACADLTPFEGGVPVFSVTRPEEAERFIAHIDALFQEEIPMHLSREQIQKAMDEWNGAWARFDLEAVLAFMDEDVLFENWTGGRARGKAALRKAWQPWFAGRDFRFIEEEVFIDEAAQKLLFRWTMEWPCPERGHEGKLERRGGVDVIHLKAGKIINKLTYSKTTVEIDDKRFHMRY